MKFKYTVCLSVCLLMMAIALAVFSGSSRGNADVCDPEIIGQIKKGGVDQRRCEKAHRRTRPGRRRVEPGPIVEVFLSSHNAHRVWF